MFQRRRAKTRIRALAACTGAGLAAATLTAIPSFEAVAAPADAGSFKDGNYLVTLAEIPAAAYSGGVKGYAATRPASGKRFDVTSAASVKYRGYLKAKHTSLLERVGASSFYDYTVALNGFAAKLTAKQAFALSKTPGVLTVQKDALRHPDTDLSPDTLGLTGQSGLWSKLGGQPNAGKGVIVGVIDTGIWPESPSFAGSAVKHNKAGQPLPGQGIRATWTGICQSGENFSSQNCNDKLIGARYFVDGFGKKLLNKDEYLSPRDGDGHGSHTASTAAGNRVDDVVVDGAPFGTVSGMAPAAQVAAYKVCWTAAPGADDGCSNSDSVAAIDQAVADGVDVINYSIGGGSESTVLDEVEVAFLFAAAAGVYNAASAGNSGPGASTLDHPSPWISTTAASTHRLAEQKLVLGNGSEFVGASTTAGLPNPTPMVMSETSGLAGVAAADAKICRLGTLDPAKVSGKLVVCIRGINDRIEKSFAVKQAGGAGMVLINPGPQPGGLAGDLHAVPTVHLETDALAPVSAYVAGANPTGKIVPLVAGDSDTATPEIAAFSSRGPSTTTGGDILKPDLAAPGVDVLAAVAPPFHHGRSYDMISGTSMASPHNAGLAALLRQAHPDWSPMAVKSALMTTAVDHVSTNSSNGGVFAQGAGFVQPNVAVDPGIVFDHGFEDWIAYLEEVTGQDIAPWAEPLDGTELNQASIAIGRLTGVETVTRTMTNVSDQAETYTPSYSLPGIDVTFSPATVTVPAGGTASVEITFTRGAAASNVYTTGSLTWTGDKGHEARMPLAVRPGDVDTAEEIHGTGASGSAEVDVTAGFTGELGHAVTGLAGATPEADSVATGPFEPTAPAAGAGTDRREVVLTDAKAVRFQTDGADGDDLDLWVYKVDGTEETLVALDADTDGDETVTLQDPEDGTYAVYVNGFATPSGGAYAYTQWIVGAGDAGNLTVAPESFVVVPGEENTFTASWAGLDTSKRWFGFIGWTRDGNEVGRTVVSVG